MLYICILKYAYNVNVTILDLFHWLSQYDPTLVRLRFFWFFPNIKMQLFLFIEISKKTTASKSLILYEFWCIDYKIQLFRKGVCFLDQFDKVLENLFSFWWLVVSCKWRQLLYLIMCYDFRGRMNLLLFLCNVRNFILGLRINHNIILSFWPEEDIGKKYTIRNEQIFLQNIQSKNRRCQLHPLEHPRIFMSQKRQASLHK